jgi:predicted amidohydrolase YtcJ
MSQALNLRNVEIGSQGGLDVRIDSGLITEVGPRLAGAGQDLDGRGGDLLPGRADHHTHLLALAAQQDSFDLADVGGPKTFADAIALAAFVKPKGDWIRATGYHERIGDPKIIAPSSSLIKASMPCWRPRYF